MSIEADVLEALQAGDNALRSSLDALSVSRDNHAAALAVVEQLQRENALLKERVAMLEARTAYLEAESVKIVEPRNIEPQILSLARAVAAARKALSAEIPDQAAKPSELTQEAALTPQPAQPAGDVALDLMDDGSLNGVLPPPLHPLRVVRERSDAQEYAG